MKKRFFNGMNEIGKSIFILNSIRQDILLAKDCINDNGPKDSRIIDISLSFMVVKIYCYFEEYDIFISLGNKYEQVKDVTRVLKPLYKQLCLIRTAIEKTRHQIIAHTHRNDKMNLSNFYEIAIKNNFPSNYNELALIIDLIELQCRTLDQYFDYAHELFSINWSVNANSDPYRKKFHSRKEFPLESIREIYTDIEAKIIANQKRLERGEQMVK